MDDKIVKPILKWVGGKTQIITSILDLIPSKINNYHEPFLGGGSVLLGVLTNIRNGKIKLKGKIYASDINEDIINLYKNIQTQPRQIIDEVKKIMNFNPKEKTEVIRKPKTFEDSQTSPESYYYWIRQEFNKLKERNTCYCSSLLLFLNKSCFRGIYRVGPNGFNVPYGNYKNLNIINDEHILEVSELIKDVIFKKASFIDSINIESMKKNDFIYLDPPYVPEKITSFVGYTKEGFDLKNHELLFNLCHLINNKNLKFILSNSAVELVINNFQMEYYHIKTILCKRSINSKNPSAKTNEVLITNF